MAHFVYSSQQLGWKKAAGSHVTRFVVLFEHHLNVVVVGKRFTFLLVVV